MAKTKNLKKLDQQKANIFCLPIKTVQFSVGAA